MYRKIAILPLLFLGATLLPGQSSPPLQSQKLTWSHQSGVSYYLVRIVDQRRKTVLRKRVKKARLRVKLPVGKYTVQITVYNRFKNVANRSDPFPLEIRKTHKPTLEPAEQKLLLANQSSTELTLQGSGFMPESIVSLERAGQGPVKVEQVQFLKADSLKVNLNLRKLKSGAYDLLVVNPGGFKTRREKAYFFSVHPSISRVSPRLLGRVQEQIITLKGRNFYKLEGRRTRVLMRSKLGRVPLKEVLILDQSTIRIRVLTKDLPLGKYDLQLENPGNLHARDFQALTITAAPIFLSLSPRAVTEGPAPKSLILLAKNIYPQTRVSITRQEQKLPIQKVEYLSPGKLRITPTPGQWDKGIYDILIENPDGRKLNHLSVLKVE